MIIINHAAALKEHVRAAKEQNKKIGFVPTMGALHKGHLSLINSSRERTDLTVCSIFVNPAQFNDPKDYEKYPVTTDKDIEFLQAAKTDVLFLPSVNEVYPRGFKDLEVYELGYLERILEGKYRPGHFQGVCQVMSRLFKIVEPHQLFMGQKDYQQCMVISKLIEIENNQDRILLQICPTVREPDGLAMSSRNLRLNPEERKKAAAIYQVLKFVKDHLQPGDLARLEIEANSMLSANDFKVDYLEIARADNLDLINEWDGKIKVVVLTAAFLNQVRLIDNLIISK